MNKIHGRTKEIALLDKTFNSENPEFLVIYGRRRVGKTFLVRKYFKKQNCTFLNITGQKASFDNRIKEIVAKLNQLNPDLPNLLGFGVSSKADVQEAIKFGLDGVIIGSVLIKELSNGVGAVVDKFASMQIN